MSIHFKIKKGGNKLKTEFKSKFFKDYKNSKIENTKKGLSRIALRNDGVFFVESARVNLHNRALKDLKSMVEELKTGDVPDILEKLEKLDIYLN